MEVGLFTLYGVIALASLLLYLLNYHYDYWKNRGIPYKPRFPLGIFNIGDIPLSIGVNEMVVKVYDKYKGTGPFAGFFLFWKPSVILLDLELFKNILIKDFNKFDDRGIFYNERDDPLTVHLFALNGSKWRVLRGKLTSIFTASKIKFMLPTIISVGENLVKVLEENIKTNSDVDIREILGRFTTDIIGTCAFGIDCNSLQDPNAEFLRIGKKIFTGSQSSVYLLFTEVFPKLARFLGLKNFPEDVTNFYTRIVRETVEYREKNNIRRNDFMDLLIDLKNTKSILSESGEELAAVNMKEVIAQSALFFFAGYETSSSAMSFALYELAQHQDIQDRLRKEINDVIGKHNGDITYEGSKEMLYLEQVINETTRKFPATTHLKRKAKEAYPTSDPKYVIPKGAIVIFPIFGIQNDPDIFPNPEIFDPDRFTPEEIKKRHPMAWLPFGDGPRNCIGMRFGKMQIRLGLAMLIRNFRFSVTKDTPIPMKLKKTSSVLSSEQAIVLKIEKICK